jgi:hypothetical protein
MLGLWNEERQATYGISYAWESWKRRKELQNEERKEGDYLIELSVNGKEMLNCILRQ